MHSSWLHLALAWAVVLAAGSSKGCADDYACSESGANALFDKRIAPLLAEERPSSCNQCHLSGVDLSLWVKETPCRTMACLAEKGIVDLHEPEASLLLQWIDRAEPESALITEQVIAQEREAVLEWIEHGAACGLCWTGSGDPCSDGDGPGYDDCALPEKPEYSDPGDCSDRTLEELFLNSFFPHRGRCYPCHFEGVVSSIDEAPKWLGVGACEIAALETMRRVTKSGYIDTEEPAKSLWLLKPLDEELGGVEHGGDSKIHSTDEEAYVQMLRFATRWADCTGKSP